MAEEILIKLSTIASLEKGQTLSTIYESPVAHNSWGTCISRTYNKEDRKKTITYIKGVFESALILAADLKSDVEGYTILVNQIRNALIGIDSLRTTYKGDYYIIGLINTIVEETNKYLEEIKIKEMDEIINAVKNSQDNPIEKYESDHHALFFKAIQTNDYLKIEDYLYDGKEPNIKNMMLQNGLHCIADKKYYNLKILNILLNFNVDVYDKDIDGNTPLYYAISTGNIECIIKLEEYISKKKRDQ